MELFTADRKYVIAFVTLSKKKPLLLFGVRVEKDLDLTEIFLIGSGPTHCDISKNLPFPIDNFIVRINW